MKFVCKVFKPQVRKKLKKNKVKKIDTVTKAPITPGKEQHKEGEQYDWI